MDKVMLLELTSEASGQHRCAQLGLPATDYELLDAMEKLQTENTAEISIDPLQYHRFQSTAKFLQEADNLAELNALAMELSRLDAEQGTAFEGLLQIEMDKGQSGIDLETLRLLAINAGADCCHVVPEARTDAELGRFYAENGFIDAVKSVPDSIFDLLDFESLGRRARTEEGGVFVQPRGTCPGGYVVQHTEWKLDRPTIRPPWRPDYTILLEVSKGFFDDPAYDNDKVVPLPLPASPQAMDTALDAVGAASWKEAGIRCVDCCAPSLIDVIGDDGNIAHINRLAQKLAGLEPKQLTKFKAVLDAANDHTVLGATQIAFGLEQYNFTPQYASPEDMAMDFLRSSMGEESAEELRPFVNIYAYGQHLMDDQGCKLTDYGVVSRDDGQSLAPPPPKHARGGMTMQTM